MIMCVLITWPSSALAKVSPSAASFDTLCCKGLGSLFIKLLHFVAGFVGLFFPFISLMTSPYHFSDTSSQYFKRSAFFYAFFFFQVKHVCKSHCMSSATHLHACLKHKCFKGPTGINKMGCLPICDALNRNSAQIFQQGGRKH